MSNLFDDLNFNKTLPHFDFPTIWLRPKSIKNKPLFFKSDFSANDISQGNGNTCFIIACFSALANQKEAFFKVVNPFQSFSSNSYNGAFYFNFFNRERREWETVTIDDYLPYNAVTKKLIFTSNINHPEEYWPALLEKAILKYLKLDYEKIGEGGDPAVIFKILFDNKVDTYYFNKKINIDHYSYLQKFSKKIWPRTIAMTAAIISPTGINNGVDHKTNLVMGHAYSVISMDCEKEQITIRNPWGSTEYLYQIINADKNDDSIENILNLNDGIFKITFKTFLKHFAYIDYIMDNEVRLVGYSPYFKINKGTSLLKSIYSKKIWVNSMNNTNNNDNPAAATGGGRGDFLANTSSLNNNIHANCNIDSLNLINSNQFFYKIKFDIEKIFKNYGKFSSDILFLIKPLWDEFNDKYHQPMYNYYYNLTVEIFQNKSILNCEVCPRLDQYRLNELGGKYISILINKLKPNDKYVNIDLKFLNVINVPKLFEVIIIEDN